LYKLDGLFAVDNTSIGVLLEDFVVQGIGQVRVFTFSSGSKDCKEQCWPALAKLVCSAGDIHLRILGIQITLVVLNESACNFHGKYSPINNIWLSCAGNRCIFLAILTESGLSSDYEFRLRTNG
jgi:hypothetical protein